MSKKVFAIIYILVIIGFVSAFIYSRQNKEINNTEPQLLDNKATNSPKQESTETDVPQITTFATGLDTPWAIAFLPDKRMLVTERPGRVRIVDAKGILDPTPVATLEKVKEIGEGGLLGITMHPDFASNHFLYLYYTYSSNGNDTLNRVVRMTFQDNKLNDEKIIIDRIPGNSNHNGGRIKFGPDKFLYITTGDAENPSQAQDINSLGGKILRVTDEGKAVTGNSFSNLIFSYGHRNPQGLAWDKIGRLWATEHGRSGVLSGLDELNFIEIGKNYGWPTIQGNETKPGMVTAYLNSGSTTWAPSGTAILGNSLFFGGLRGTTLYELDISNDEKKVTEHFKGEFGRIREVILGPDSMLYFTTSNSDGRGNPTRDDDRIIRVNPNKI